MRAQQSGGQGQRFLCYLVGLGLVISVLFAPRARGQAEEQPLPPVLVVDVREASSTERLTAASLQGIANRTPRPPSVLLITKERDQDWLAYVVRMLGRPTERLTLEELFGRLKGEVKGQVLYDPARPYTADLATTAAGMREAVISDTDLGLPTLFDFRGNLPGTDWKSAEEAYWWALDALLPHCQARRAAVLPASRPAGGPSEALAFRDYAIQQGMFTIAAPQSTAVLGEDSALRELFFRLMPGSVIYGRLPDAARGLPSEYSHSLVPVSETANLSFLSRVAPPGPPFQHVGYLESAAAKYLTLIFDCSEVDFAADDMAEVWDDPVRGTMPLGWALPAALGEMAPPVLHQYYADAYRSGLDQFVLGPSGAGELDISAARSPYSFYQATAAACKRMDAHTTLYDASTGTQELDIFVPQLIAESGVRGVFVTGGPDFSPYLYSGAPVIPAPRISALKQAVQYLDRLPPDRRFAALCLDPRSLTPADAAHLAAYLGRRFVIAGPEEMVELARAEGPGMAEGEGEATVSSVDYPETVEATAPIPIRARVGNPKAVRSLTAVYHPVNHRLAFARPMVQKGDTYLAEIPPLYCGGEFDVRVRAVDGQGRVSWSPPWILEVPWEDADEDGLTDAEERFLLTDVSLVDTDGDGLTDGNDLAALRPDHVSQCYFGPLLPPSERPYLLERTGGEAGEGDATAAQRLLRPGESALYWLPTAMVPKGARFSVRLAGNGNAAISILARRPVTSDDLANADAHATGAVFSDAWYSPALLGDDYPDGAWLRLTCPSLPAVVPFAIGGVALVSPPLCPSITKAAVLPAHPGPEQLIYLSAQVFSPRELAEVTISYRVNGGGTVTFPMQALGWGQRYEAHLPASSNRDQVEWWITARDADGNQATTPPALIVVGSWARETASLVATREFTGDWTPDTIAFGGGEEVARSAGADGLVDTGAVNLTGGNYAVWALAGGRGKGVGVYVKDTRVGGIEPQAPDGWQMVGRIRLEVGHYGVQMVSEPGPAGTDPGSAPRYAAVMLSADPSFKPPAEHLLDAYNSLSLFFPSAEQVLTGRVELLATGSGNVTGAQFSIDGEPLRPAFGPPFKLALSTARYENGAHTLRVEGLDRAGLTGLVLEIPISIAN